MGNLGILIPIVAIFGWIIISCVKIVYGYPRGKYKGRHGAELAQQQVETALAERDATIVALRERIEVLERIVTDKSTQLGQEIERLRA